MDSASRNTVDAPLVVGIDCGKKPSHLGIAIASVSHDSVVLEDVFSAHENHKRLGKRGYRESFKQRLVRYLARRLKSNASTLVALDAPLGWPRGMRRALQHHQAGRRIAVTSDGMFRRETDRFLKQKTGKTALSVGADRIAWIAHDAVTLLQQIRAESGLEIPMAWGQGPPKQPTAIEVYPATELIARGLEASGYKGKAEAHRKARDNVLCKLESDVRDRIDKSLPRLSRESLAPFRERLVQTDHLLDAALCVLTGAAFLSGNCMPLPPNLDIASRREGWIWFNRRAARSHDNDNAAEEGAG